MTVSTWKAPTTAPKPTRPKAKTPPKVTGEKIEHQSKRDRVSSEDELWAVTDELMTDWRS